jgi:hypothetical protein
MEWAYGDFPWDDSLLFDAPPLPSTSRAPMQTLRVNGYDMAYLEIGEGSPLVCVHGTLGDFRTWSAVFGPLSKTRRVISVSLRRFFPEHWDGVGDDFLMAQHVADVIGFIERLDAGPVDLMGHSRGGHIAFRGSAEADRRRILKWQQLSDHRWLPDRGTSSRLQQRRRERRAPGPSALRKVSVLLHLQSNFKVYIYCIPRNSR